ncbi:MAG: hypothetical protein SV429_12860 [Pseudomonadota bacterium]|nr:hypothetical protein [Pseudomonadota bacterium]
MSKVTFTTMMAVSLEFGRLVDVVYTLIADCVLKHCSGCEIDDPSQKHHSCLMMEKEERVESYFEEAWEKTSHEEVLGTVKRLLYVALITKSRRLDAE